MKPLVIVLVTAAVTAVATSVVWLAANEGMRERMVASHAASAVRIALKPKPVPAMRGPAATPSVQGPAPPSTPVPIPPNARIGIDPDDLLAKHLTIPVQGVTAARLRPNFYDDRGQRGHEAIDIMAPKGTPVVAVEDGKIAKFFTSVRGGITIYQFDPGQKYAYYYAHLDGYADGLKEGDSVMRGQIIGYVGSTGDAVPSAPHLHFAISLLGPQKQWWKGDAIDPYPALTVR